MQQGRVAGVVLEGREVEPALAVGAEAAEAEAVVLGDLGPLVAVVVQDVERGGFVADGVVDVERVDVLGTEGDDAVDDLLVLVLGREQARQAGRRPLLAVVVLDAVDGRRPDVVVGDRVPGAQGAGDPRPGVAVVVVDAELGGA